MAVRLTGCGSLEDTTPVPTPSMMHHNIANAVHSFSLAILGICIA